MIRSLVTGLALALLAGAVSAQDVKHTYGAPDAPIASSVFVPAGAEMLFVSGTTAPPPPPPVAGATVDFGNTEAQTDAALTHIETILKAQGFGPGDVVKMTVFLVGDPATGKMDFAGMMSAYKRHYGTPDQPNRPARTTVQVTSLAGPHALVEIEVVAAKKPGS
jgi:enamine deaminase RidA (YjgF/YER057c/UK114 family)